MEGEKEKSPKERGRIDRLRERRKKVASKEDEEGREGVPWGKVRGGGVVTEGKGEEEGRGKGDLEESGMGEEVTFQV